MPNYPGGEVSLIDWSKPIPTPSLPIRPMSLPHGKETEGDKDEKYSRESCTDAQGKNYNEGETYSAGDNCNTCECMAHGAPSCTR